jgi:hypothetical protein
VSRTQTQHESKIEKQNVQVIWDVDHGPENEGWYSRHDEYKDGELCNGACDNALDAESVEDAVAETRRDLGLSDDVEVEVIDRR